MLRKNLILSFLLLFCCTLLPLIGYAWYRFHQPLASHIDLSSQINPQDYHLPLEQHSFQTADGLNLAGYSATQPEAKAWTILVHGFSKNGWKSTLETAEFLFQERYNIFIPSLRGFGDSDGDKVSLGTQEWQDILAANNFVQTHLNSDKIKVGWYGGSMGTTSLLVAAEKDPQPDFLIAQVPFVSVENLLIPQIKANSLLEVLFEPLTHIIPQLEFGWQYQENTPISHLDKITAPILVIGAQHDTEVLPEDSQIIFDQVSTAAEQKVIAKIEAGHDVFAEKPEEVKQVVREFLANQ